MKKNKYVFALILYIMFTQALSAEAIVFSYYENPNNLLTISDILKRLFAFRDSPEQLGFVPDTETDGTFWLYSDIDDKHLDNGGLFLEIPKGSFWRCNVFVLDENGKVLRSESYKEKDPGPVQFAYSKALYYAFPDIDSQNKLLIRFKSFDIFNNEVRTLSQAQYRSKTNREFLLLIVEVSIVLTVALLFLLRFLKKPGKRWPIIVYFAAAILYYLSSAGAISFSDSAISRYDFETFCACLTVVGITLYAAILEIRTCNYRYLLLSATAFILIIAANFLMSVIWQSKVLSSVVVVFGYSCMLALGVFGIKRIFRKNTADVICGITLLWFIVSAIFAELYTLGVLRNIGTVSTYRIELLLNMVTAAGLLVSMYITDKGMQETDPAAGRLQDETLQALTSRQREVLELVIKGYTNPEIAALLQISVRTVSYHVSELLKKSGVERRTQLSFEYLSGE